MEGLGFIMLWGYTPAINVFCSVENIEVQKDDKEINILISETGGDARHLMKSFSDILPIQNQRQNKINIYLHEKNKENLARTILFMTLFCETGISERERMEMFLDLYGNSLIREKTAEYLQNVTPELIQLVTEDDKGKSIVKELFNFETLKFKDRDDLEEIFSSYLKNHIYDIEKLRDHRLRGHFKDRYDFRRNLVDWDYSFSIKEYAKYINLREYRDWRLTGIAFETRLATGTVPNRTLGSYVEGKSKKGNDSILVRGYWGDIINSPYISFGNEVWDPEHKMRFYKQVNYQQVYSNHDVTEYNVQAYIHKLEQMNEYEFPFERLKHILGKQYEDPKKKKNKEGEMDQINEDEEEQKEEEEEDKKEEEETTVQELTDEQAAEEQKKIDERERKKLEDAESTDTSSRISKTADEVKEKLLKEGSKTIDLSHIEESKNEVKQENIGTRGLLNGFKQLNVKIHLLSDDLDKIFTKQKYSELFDIAALSINSANNIDKEGFNNVFKNGAYVHIETADNLAVLKKEEKPIFRQKIIEKCEKAKWRPAKESPYNHHLLYQVQK